MKYMYNVLWLIGLSIPCTLLSLHVRVMSFPSKAGLLKDIEVFEEVLHFLQHSTERHLVPEMVKELDQNTFEIADVQIFMQEFDERLLPFGKKNYLVPNPEWCWDTIDSLKKVDLILARTKEVERIYTAEGLSVYYIGFTSKDHYIDEIEKNFCGFFHLKGFSDHKSSPEIVDAWLTDFPPLILIDHWPSYKKIPFNISILQGYLKDEEVSWLQNSLGVHLCPSQTEGFGHYLVEAMSTGAVIITTDAPPMNEFIQDKRFLIKPKWTSKHGFATLYHISSKDLRETIHTVTQMPLDNLKEVGLENRNRYLTMKSEFIERLKRLLSE